MEKIDKKILNYLPVKQDYAKSESDILAAIGCSHGSCYNALKSLLAAGVIAVYSANRRKLYYRIIADNDNVKSPYQVTNYELSKTQKSTVTPKMIKPLISADYNDNCEGIYQSLQQAVDIIQRDLSGCEWVQYNSDKDNLTVCVTSADGVAMYRYDYARLSSGCVEVWRYRVRQTYVRRGK